MEEKLNSETPVDAKGSQVLNPVIELRWRISGGFRWVSGVEVRARTVLWWSVYLPVYDRATGISLRKVPYPAVSKMGI